MRNPSKECYAFLFGRNWPDLTKFRIYIGLNRDSSFVSLGVSTSKW